MMCHFFGRRRAGATMLRILAACAVLPGAMAAHAAQPEAEGRSVNLIVPYPAGGASDAGARLFAAPFAEALGQTVVVENLGGATGAVAANKVLAAAANGRDVFYGSPNEVILSPLVNPAIRFKPQDFMLVHPLSTSALVLVARADLPVNSLDEFIAQARQSTRPLSFGSVGVGSLYHLVVEHLGRKVGAQFNHVPYKGSAPVLNDLAGGQIDFAVLPYQASIDGLARQGRLRMVSCLSRIRPTVLAHVPSVGESRLLRDFDFSIWGGLFVKKGTPDAIVASLQAATAKSLSDPALRQRLEEEGRIPFEAMSAAQVAELHRTQIGRYEALIKSVGFKAD